MNNKSRLFLLPLLIIVIGNYLAQILYGFHQYHGQFNPIGTLFLLLTLVWFLLGYFLMQKRKRIGYWLLLSFLLLQSIFYFYNEVILSFFGYGILYHFVHNSDKILWIVFFIGDINFFAACFYSYLLINRKSQLI